ncbi:hypothetical protein GUJ93_ZPchr0001g30610 [Zizania palustris]|uniref:Uncharacterized protein n=1 Tax=Zizania palustris TaxID=103762 RepID=A0A8J5RX85_ZIZPA|nr:hypothetical protein GUJ93_ZPchr0001g30610 [Zizania palustris]
MKKGIISIEECPSRARVVPGRRRQGQPCSRCLSLLLVANLGNHLVEGEGGGVLTEEWGTAALVGNNGNACGEQWEESRAILRLKPSRD